MLRAQGLLLSCGAGQIPEKVDVGKRLMLIGGVGSI